MRNIVAGREIKVVNLNSDIDSQTQEWLDTFYSASDDKVEAIKDRNNALVGLGPRR